MLLLLLKLRNVAVALVFLALSFANTSFAQLFPNPAALSTGQGAPGTIDPIWQASTFWYAASPPNPMGLTYITTLINNNCAPGSWVDPASLPPPVNNGNWITGSDDDCATNTNSGYRYFRLTLNLPPDCNGYSVTVPGNYILNLVGYADNTISDVFVNGVSSGISGGGFGPGTQLNIALTGPWVAGANYVDVLVYNFPSNPGDINPYGLLLVADANATDAMDTDGDGISNLNDLCPCDVGNNPYGCMDPASHNCDIDLIRQTFANAGCIEMPGCSDECSIYFLNPQSLSGAAAQNFAQTLGANLVSIQSQAENDCVLASLSNLNLASTEVIWIGFSDELIEGSFVWYDQSPISYTNWAPGEPNNSGDEDCVQIYPDGSWNDLPCSASNSKSIIEVNLCPVTNVGTDQIICLDESTNVSVTQTLYGSSPYSYQWNNGATSQSIAVTPIVTDTFSVQITDAYSCEAMDTMIVTVLTIPTVTFSADTVCLGNPTQFVNNSNTTGGATIVSSNWNFGDGATSTATNPTHSYATNGVFTVSLIIISSNGCSDTVTENVIVNEQPLANFTTSNICFGNSSNFLNTSVFSGTFASIDWDFGDGSTSTVQNPVHTFASENTYTTQLIVTTAEGCKDTSQLQVNVYPLPILDFSATDVCQEMSNQFIANTSISSVYTSNSITSLSYNFDDGTSSSVATIDHLYQNDGVYNVTLVATSNHGCTDSIQKLVTVYPKPIAQFSGVDLAGCSPICPVITSNSTINTPGIISNYSWVYSDGVNDNGLFTTRCFEDSLHITSNYGITLFVESDMGCKDTLISASNYISLYHNPIADFNFSPTEPDLDHTIIDFDNNSSYANSYLWNIPSIYSSTLVNPSVNVPYAPGVYEIQLIASTSDNCRDTLVKSFTVKDLVVVFVPNTFTPDSDEFNPTFKPIIGAGVDLTTYSFYIYNRWGEMVFESYDASIGWDGTYNGKLVNTDMFIWELTYKTRASDEKQRKVGHLNLLR